MSTVEVAVYPPDEATESPPAEDRAPKPGAVDRVKKDSADTEKKDEKREQHRVGLIDILK